MQIANRESFAVASTRRRGWTNPYITDGLVAMWDGVWNAGGGVHDATATTWKNLMGDTRLDLDISGMVVGANYIDTNRAASHTQAVLQQTDFTIEVVAQSVKDTYWADIEYFLGYGSAGSMPLGFGPTGSWNTLLFYRYGSTAGKSDSSSYGSLAELTSLNGWSGRSLMNGTRAVYKNGAQLANSTWVPRQGSYSASSQNWLGIGVKLSRNNTVSSNTNTMKLYNLRYYARALTAAEIAANHAIDRERFNTP